jgi:hypothetical protein
MVKLHKEKNASMAVYCVRIIYQPYATEPLMDTTGSKS